MISHSFLSRYGRITLLRQLTTASSEYFTKSAKVDKLLNLIKTHTVLSCNHLTPEIQLHLITPECKLWSSSLSDAIFEDPFWAFYWPGGQVISRYILDNPNIVKNQSVLDIGCGSGACSIAASLAGAYRVIANDIDTAACVATSLNAMLNRVNVEISASNFIGEDVPCDCVILGDMFYDGEFASKLLDWLQNLRAKNKTILIGDPGRWAFQNDNLRERLTLLAEYSLPENVIEENNGFSSASVWKFT